MMEREYDPYEYELDGPEWEPPPTPEQLAHDRIADEQELDADAGAYDEPIEARILSYTNIVRETRPL